MIVANLCNLVNTRNRQPILELTTTLESGTVFIQITRLKGLAYRKFKLHFHALHLESLRHCRNKILDTIPIFTTRIYLEILFAFALLCQASNGGN